MIVSDIDKRTAYGSSDTLSYSVAQIHCKTDEDRFYHNILHDAESLSISSFAIFDGHGGAHASNKCSSVLHDRIISRYLAQMDCFDVSKSIPGNVSNEFNEKFFCECVQVAINQIDSEIKLEDKAGTTAVSIFVIQNKKDRTHRVLCSWVGDSGCAMFQKYPNSHEIRSVRMTQDHKPSLGRENDRIHKRGSATQLDSESYRVSSLIYMRYVFILVVVVWCQLKLCY